MNEARKPVYLFADSHLLFWKTNDTPFLESVRLATKHDSPSGAYIGASNGDDPIFYGIFEAAMDSIGVRNRRLIPSVPSVDDLSFLNDAQLVLLSGGDVDLGLRTLKQNGVGEIVARKYSEGAVLIGISAGAVQLGLSTLRDDSESATPVGTLQLLNCIIGVHEESDNWKNLRAAVGAFIKPVRGIGIPSGGGAIYHPDNSIQPVRTSLAEF